jgi:hypothetical protein
MSSKKSGQESDVYEFRRTIERSLVDMMILFPKRSAIWGMNWAKEQIQESKDETYVETKVK